MFLASVGEESDVDVFTFLLAHDLGKTLGELDDMPAAEMANWRAFYKVKRQQEQLAHKAASHG